VHLVRFIVNTAVKIPKPLDYILRKTDEERRWDLCDLETYFWEVTAPNFFDTSLIDLRRESRKFPVLQVIHVGLFNSSL